MGVPEVRLVSVSWKGPDELRAVRAAHFPLLLKPAGDGEWVGTAATYSDVGGAPAQLAVLGDGLEAPPAIVVDGVERPLTPVTGKDGRTWWVQVGEWDDRGYYLDPTVNSGGRVTYQVGGARVEIDVVPSAFAPEEFEAMIDDFRDGLWGMVLDGTRASSVERYHGAGGGGDEFERAVADLADAAGRAVRNPHAELRETTVWSRPGRARPSPETFQAMARRGAPRTVPSRGHAPTHDTPENRSLLAMVRLIEQAVRASQRASIAKARDLDKRAERLRTRLSMNREGEKWLPEARMKRDLADLRARAAEWRAAMGRVTAGGFPPSPESQPINRTVRIARSFRKANGAVHEPYFAARDYTHGDYCKVTTVLEGRKGKRGVDLELWFSADRSDVERAFPERVEGWTFPLRGSVTKAKDKRPHRTKDTHYLRVVEMELVERGPFDAEIEALKGALTEVVTGPGGARGTWRALGSGEAEEQARSTAASEKAMARYEGGAERWRRRADGLAKLGDRLRQARRRLNNDLGVKDRAETDAVAFGSMVYVHNPHYRAALGAYRRARRQLDVTEGVVDGLFALDDVGVLDLPAVYERWGLLQLVKVLTEDFRFGTEDAGAVLDALTSVRGRRTVRVDLRSEACRRRVALAYQPWIETSKGNRQPDYALTLYSLAGGEGRTMVLDAKFKPFAPLDRAAGLGEGDLAGEIEGLLYEKDYWQGGTNRVFVLHPGPAGVTEAESERYTALGGEPVSGRPDSRRDWDQERHELEGRLNHDVGAVMVRPGFRDDLRRLVHMHLMEGVRDTDALALGLRRSHLPPICPSCGGVLYGLPRLEYKFKKDGTKDYPVRAVYACGSVACGHESVRTYCASQRCLRHLWKLGSWNYHATRPMDPYDVKCPNCTTYRPVYPSGPTEASDP